ncbi:hypothetical protein ACIQPR_47690 [Streptomyces sp. NPDC091280]|uniref:hypothetical protein n=1 Tax=Streptomyces sp. NPDC091280 TaxID=3365984 RepID=UPI0038239CE4
MRKLTPDVVVLKASRGADRTVSVSVVDARMVGMPLSDYFLAADDQAAVTVLQVLGGPSRADLDVVLLENFDPVAAIPQLEAIMTGCSFEEASDHSRSGQMLSDPQGEGAFVVSLRDTLTAALASASQDDLLRFAEPWSRTDELEQLGMSVEVTAEILEVLAGLARRAQASSERLYCWWAP